MIIDVTATLSHLNFTGVQRVVTAVLRASPGHRLVKYDMRLDAFCEATLTNVEPEPSQAQGASHAPVYALALWAIFRSFLRLVGLGRFAELVRRWASSGYAVSRGRTGPSTVPYFEGRVVEKHSLGDVILLDVPKDPAHLRFLRLGIEQGDFKLHVYLYDLIPLESEEIAGDPRSLEDREWYKDYLNLVTRADTVVCLSRFTRDRFLAFCRDSQSDFTGKVVVLYPPWESSTQHQQHLCARNPRNLWAFLERTDHGPIVMAVAPLSKRKNLWVLFRSFLAMRRMGRRLRLLVIVPLSTHVDLKTALLAAWLRFLYPHSVTFQTRVAEQTLSACFQHAHVVCVPSLLEGFGLPVIEGLEHGCHALAHAGGPFLELNEKLDIALADARDPREWRRALETLVDSDKAEAFDASSMLPSPQSFMNQFDGHIRRPGQEQGEIH